MPPVEQIKAKRAGLGLRALDMEKACPGVTLFAPQSGGGKVYLIDLEGNVSTTWRFPILPGNPGISTEKGIFFSTGKPTRTSNPFSTGKPWKAAPRLKATGTVR